MNEEQGRAGIVWAVVLSGLLTLGAALGADKMLPFYSVTFVLGVATCFYYAISYGPRPGLFLGAAVLMALLLQAIGEGGVKLEVVLWQIPFLTIFFLGYATPPSALPAILDQETAVLSQEANHLSRKVEELKETLLDEHKERVQDKGSMAKEDTVRITSRTTQLTTFLREVLQAASTKEILNLLFSNTTKSYGNLEVGLVLVISGGEEFLISRAGHPEHEELENMRLPSSEVSVLANATRRRVPILLPERIPIVSKYDFSCRIVVPVWVEDTCEGVITLGETRGGGELVAEDAQFLGTFAELAGDAMGQMKVVLS